MREIIGIPSHRASGKVIDHYDDICARYIERSSYVIVATRSADGLLDLSPKGDPAGFVHVLDPKTLIIPERPGNKRVDSFENLLLHSDGRC